VIQCSRTRNENHYTEKPVELLVTLLQQDERSQRRKCPVYDPFGGSGSTIIACEKIGRRGLMTEVEPHYVDVAVRRWEEFTGGKAELVT
jgi:DNA modification methylase